jgi:dUTP pyrophosphatase
MKYLVLLLLITSCASDSGLRTENYNKDAEIMSIIKKNNWQQFLEEIRQIMKIKVKRIEERAQLPQFQTEGAAGFDLHSIDDITVPAGGTKVIRTGLAFEIEPGYEVQIRPRSGLSAKSKIRIANAPGTIDSDYSKEIMIIVDNISQNQADSFRINMGDRIAQAVVKRVEPVEIIEVETINETNRGGLGSTGV